jgi:hypothetical protein
VQLRRPRRPKDPFPLARSASMPLWKTLLLGWPPLALALALALALVLLQPWQGLALGPLAQLFWVQQVSAQAQLFVLLERGPEPGLELVAVADQASIAAAETEVAHQTAAAAAAAVRRIRRRTPHTHPAAAAGHHVHRTHPAAVHRSHHTHPEEVPHTRPAEVRRILRLEQTTEGEALVTAFMWQQQMTQSTRGKGWIES